MPRPSTAPLTVDRLGKMHCLLRLPEMACVQSSAPVLGQGNDNHTHMVMPLPRNLLSSPRLRT